MSTTTFDTSVASGETRSLLAMILSLFGKPRSATPAKNDAWYAVARGM